MTKQVDMTRYNAACEAHSAAFKTFDAIRAGYRARTVDDETFLAARAEYQAVLAAVEREHQAIEAQMEVA